MKDEWQKVKEAREDLRAILKTALDVAEEYQATSGPGTRERREGMYVSSVLRSALDALTDHDGRDKDRILHAYTLFEDSNGWRVWVYYTALRPEFVPGYWDVENEGLENETARKWAKDMNDWMRSMQERGKPYEEMERRARDVMRNDGFMLVKEFRPEEVGAIDWRDVKAM